MAEYLTLRDAAQVTGRSYLELWTLCRAGKIRHHRRGVNNTGAYLVRLEWINEYIESTVVEPKQQNKRNRSATDPQRIVSKPRKKSSGFVGFAKRVDSITVRA